MENLIQKYLKQNNVEGKNGVDYRLENSGNGIEIKGWKLSIEKPTFTQEEIVLDQAKLNKLQEIKQIRNLKTEGGKLYNIKVDGVDCSFFQKNSDLANLNAKLKLLTNNTATINWTNSAGQRVGLNKTAFEGLMRHISADDTALYDWYYAKKDEIEDATSLEALEQIDINFNL